MVVCLDRGAVWHMAQLMPLPLTVSSLGFTFLVPARLGCPGKRAVKRVFVCVYVCVCYLYFILQSMIAFSIKIRDVCYSEVAEF